MINLFTKGNYYFSQFSYIHLKGVVVSIILSMLLMLVGMFFNKKKFATFLGYLFIILKIYETYYRIFIEKYPFYDNLPLHLCNIAFIVGAIYLITKSKIMYNILYHFLYGAILVLILPSYFPYSTKFYIYFFFFMHVLEIFIVIYGKMYLGARVTNNGYIISIITYIILVIIALFVNRELHTNFMYVNDYILPQFKIISFNIYLVIYVLMNILFMSMMNLFSKK